MTSFHYTGWFIGFPLLDCYNPIYIYFIYICMYIYICICICIYIYTYIGQYDPLSSSTNQQGSRRPPGSTNLGFECLWARAVPASNAQVRSVANELAARCGLCKFRAVDGLEQHADVWFHDGTQKKSFFCLVSSRAFLKHCQGICMWSPAKKLTLISSPTTDHGPFQLPRHSPLFLPWQEKTSGSCSYGSLLTKDVLAG